MDLKAQRREIVKDGGDNHSARPCINVQRTVSVETWAVDTRRLAGNRTRSGKLCNSIEHSEVSVDYNCFKRGRQMARKPQNK